MNRDALRSVPLFHALDDEAADELCALLTMRDVEAGTLLFRRGEPGDSMYLIERGRVRISVKDTDGHDATLAAEHKKLDEELAERWEEQRIVRANIRFGDRDLIIQRARHEERLSRAA